LWQIGKNVKKFFDRPKPTVGCSANGRRRRRKVEEEEGEEECFSKWLFLFVISHVYYLCNFSFLNQLNLFIFSFCLNARSKTFLLNERHNEDSILLLLINRDLHAFSRIEVYGET